MLKGRIETEDRKESEGKGDYKTAGCTKGPNKLLSAAQKEHKNINDAISTILHSVLKLCLVCQPAFFLLIFVLLLTLLIHTGTPERLGAHPCASNVDP